MLVKSAGWCPSCGAEPGRFHADNCRVLSTTDKLDEQGGTKHDQEKPRFDLLSYPFLLGVSKVLTFGASKYEAHNWRKGITYSRIFGAIMRHLWAWWWGEDKDPETGYSHLWHAATELMFLAEFEQTRPDLDDRWKGYNLASEF